jgi:hypothetical protein
MSQGPLVPPVLPSIRPVSQYQLNLLLDRLDGLNEILAYRVAAKPIPGVDNEFYAKCKSAQKLLADLLDAADWRCCEI